MATPRKYFHDKLVLLLLTVNIFFGLTVIANTIFRLDFGRSGGYIVQYRANLDLNAYKTGDAWSLASFALIAAGIVVLHAIISYRIYPLKRFASLMVLFLGLLLIILTLITSNALLVLD